MTMTAIKPIKLRITLNNEHNIVGFINLDRFDRFSDFMEKSEDTHLKVFNAVVSGREEPFILVPKNKVLYYCPLKEEKI